MDSEAGIANKHIRSRQVLPIRNFFPTQFFIDWIEILRNFNVIRDAKSMAR